jgi:hypothetical protein
VGAKGTVVSVRNRWTKLSYMNRRNREGDNAYHCTGEHERNHAINPGHGWGSKNTSVLQTIHREILRLTSGHQVMFGCGAMSARTTNL